MRRKKLPWLGASSVQEVPSPYVYCSWISVKLRNGSEQEEAAAGLPF